MSFYSPPPSVFLDLHLLFLLFTMAPPFPLSLSNSPPLNLRMHVQERVNRAERQFQSLPEHHQLLLPGVLPNLARIRRSVDHNQEVLQAIVLNCIHMFENMEYGEEVS